MNQYSKMPALLLLATISMFLTGCVERTLTINSNPSDALLTLNDEEIGRTPVTVSFNWYGDYNVRLSKNDYQTLVTHRKLNRPWYDKFPFDFFAQIINPKKIVDAYDWSFDLQPRQKTDIDKIVKKAQLMRTEIKK
ncbi:MAG: PEGA domain-containing protein [Phycisphaerae bacterium]|nr:PEGA domain-containing protein [Phycisphaerae bacterium]